MIQKLICRIFFFFFLIALSCFAIFRYSPLTNYDYLAAARDKHLLLKSSPSPKIILVGGSNLAFGVDSQEIEQKTGYHAVNMGLHAMLGLRYMLSEIKEDLTTDDIVIISLEYEHFSTPVINGGEELFQMLLFCPELISYLDYKHFLPMVKNIPKVLQISFRWIVDSVYEKLFLHKIPKKKIYVRSAFNRYGDATHHLDLPSPEKFLHEIAIPSSFSTGSEEVLVLNNFLVNAKKKHVKVYFLFPSIPDYTFNQYKNNINNFYQWLKRNVKIPILSTPEYFVLPKDNFFDTPYHLNRKGRELRTQKMISTLKKILKNNPTPQTNNFQMNNV